ncbi:MAG: hypothetical protein WCH21_03635 [Bacteroidota bacterium]
MKTELCQILYQTYEEYVLTAFSVEEFAELKGISVDMMKAIIQEFAGE